MNDVTITVAIPTHGRAIYLSEALQSVFRQTCLPLEIVVSDDSASSEVATVVERLRSRSPTPLRLCHCREGAGLARNVNSCFDHATGEWLCLLHDDDLLTDEALAHLAGCISQHPSLSGIFGRQRVIDAGGKELSNLTLSTNELHERRGNSRLIDSGARAGVLQMFPNDGYLVKTAVARAVRHDPQWGGASEVDFGIRLGERGSFFYIAEFVSAYRLSEHSLSRGFGRRTDDCGLMLMRLLERAVAEGLVSESEISPRMRDRIRVAIAQATKLGLLEEAWRWLLSRYHRRQIFSLGGMRRTLALLVARSTRATLSLRKGRADAMALPAGGASRGGGDL